MGSATPQTESYFLSRGEAQYRFRSDMGPGHSILRMGWGGGKTFTGADKACGRAQDNQRNGLLFSQHYRHLKHVMVGALYECAEVQRLGPKWLPSDKILLFRALPRANQYGCQFAVGMSADAPDAIRAFQGTWAWGDEPAAYSQSSIESSRDAFLQMAGRVRGEDKAPGRDWTGTNEGEGTRFYDLQTDAERIASGDVRVYTGSTIDNLAYVGKDFIDEVEATLPDELLEQYLHGGVGQLAQEMAAWAWSKVFEVPCSIQVDRPLVTCWDFGIAPMAMSVAQRDSDDPMAIMRWIGEVVMPLRGNTEEVAERFCAEYRPQHPGPIIVKGDATGAAGSPQHKWHNYEQIMAILLRHWPGQVIFDVPEGNPAIPTRLLRANAAIKRGLVRVDPSCTNVLRDLNGCKLRQTEGGVKEDQKDGYSHSWVGMCYPLHDYYPFVIPKNRHIATEGQRTHLPLGEDTPPGWKFGDMTRRAPGG